MIINRPEKEHPPGPCRNSLSGRTRALVEQQCLDWELARNNYAALEQVRIRYPESGSQGSCRIQYNPGRIRSSSAKVDPESISRRPCFLCTENLPGDQRWAEGPNDIRVLVNPFPIFPRHLTLPSTMHLPQRISGRFRQMLDLSKLLPDYTLFYNGPKCGASAPDHFHFQAGNRGFLPVEERYLTHSHIMPVGISGLEFRLLDDAPFRAWVLRAPKAAIIHEAFERLYRGMKPENEQTGPGTSLEEPMLNILAWYEKNGKDSRYVSVIYPRTAHRPLEYFAEGDDKILFSPASVDLAGVLVCPREEDFQRMNNSLITRMLDQLLPDISWLRETAIKLLT